MQHSHFQLKLKDLLIRSIFAWCDLLSSDNSLSVPIIQMELTFDDQRMQFYPAPHIIHELFQSVVDTIAESLPGVSCPHRFSTLKLALS